MIDSKKDRISSVIGIVGISVVGMIVILCSNGLTLTGITAFDETLLEEFGWSKSELKFRDTLNLVIASILAPFVGLVIDRFGVKNTMLTGLALLSLLVFSYSYVHSLMHIYIIHSVFAVAISMAGTLAVVIMVTQRITKMRGTALGIALSGTSAGGIVLAPLATYLVREYDWRSAFKLEAILPLLAIMLVFLFVKNIKYSKENKSEEETGLTEISFSTALKSTPFWLIAIAGFFCFYTILGIIGNLFLYLREMGYSPEVTSSIFGTFFFIILCAKFASGFLTDYINKYLLFKIQLIMMLVGTICFSLNTPTFAWPAIVLTGLGWGGLYTLFNYIIITTFGVKNAGKINGVISTFEGIGSGLGIWLTALISDKTGDYSASFWLMVAFLASAFICSFFIKPVAEHAN